MGGGGGKDPKNPISKNSHKIAQAKSFQFSNLSLVKHKQMRFPGMFTNFSFYFGGQ